jgi:hypothetical protein
LEIWCLFGAVPEERECYCGCAQALLLHNFTYFFGPYCMPLTRCSLAGSMTIRQILERPSGCGYAISEGAYTSIGATEVSKFPPRVVRMQIAPLVLQWFQTLQDSLPLGNSPVRLTLETAALPRFLSSQRRHPTLPSSRW